MSQSLSDRFYQTVDIIVDGEQYLVRLDGRSPKTPAGAKLSLPTEKAAQLVSQEWDDQKEKINLAAMPSTRIAFSALDQVKPHYDHVASELAVYGGSDLVCFLADEPDMLIERQMAAWAPLHDWFAQRWETELEITHGIIGEMQAPATLRAIEDAVRGHDVFQLAALHGLTKLSGSIIIALAVSTGRLEVEDAWSASRIDEDWQIERWGRDVEAERLAETKKADFTAHAIFLKSVS